MSLVLIVAIGRLEAKLLRDVFVDVPSVLPAIFLLSSPNGLPMLMDRAYESGETRQLMLQLGMVHIVPPKSNRIGPWKYDHALYKKHNEIERLFRRLKAFGRIFSRFEKQKVIFPGLLSFTFIVEALR